MNRCFSCRNNRRQLLMLKCGHDVCIKCAADNYFINCKNKLNPKRSRQVGSELFRATIFVRNAWNRRSWSRRRSSS